MQHWQLSSRFHERETEGTPSLFMETKNFLAYTWKTWEFCGNETLTCGILRTGKMHRWQTSEFHERQSCRTRHPALHIWRRSIQ
jgi:hypothetical protein